MWRPKGWESEKIVRSWGKLTLEGEYERGADAILEALKENGSLMTPEQMGLIARDRKYPYGWLVFIPEMEG